MHVAWLHRLADRLQQTAARSAFLVRCAILIRNQARCVIKYHLAEGPNVSDTGERWLQDVAARSGERFIDVGANVGDWLAGLAGLKGRTPFQAIAFEPSQSALQLLSSRFATDPRIEIVPMAVGDCAGELTFVEEPEAGKGSSLVAGFARFEGRARTVNVTTLDDEMEKRGWKTVDFIKVDAEGFDARVVRGCGRALRDGRIGVLQFEYNRAWQLAGETLYGCYRMLESCGYRVFLLKREGLYVLDYGRYEEYYEYSNFVAIAPSAMARYESFVRGTI